LRLLAGFSTERPPLGRYPTGNSDFIFNAYRQLTF
jgi:hypothetical protein